MRHLQDECRKRGRLAGARADQGPPAGQRGAIRGNGRAQLPSPSTPFAACPHASSLPPLHAWFSDRRLPPLNRLRAAAIKSHARLLARTSHAGISSSLRSRSSQLSLTSWLCFVVPLSCSRPLNHFASSHARRLVVPRRQLRRARRQWLVLRARSPSPPRSPPAPSRPPPSS